jgi:Flp pilus assembly protein TadB
MFAIDIGTALIWVAVIVVLGPLILGLIATMIFGVCLLIMVWWESRQAKKEEKRNGHI